MAHYKLGIYGEPATGKSVFSLHWPKPFFITTDSNYEFLYEFGAKEEDHCQVHSWSEFKKLVKDFDFSKYETIVIDVLEDLYLWAEAEYCTKNRIEDLSDVGYGKAYKIVRNDFALEVFKLLGKDANVIILTHCDETQGKTARGGEFTAYTPSKVIPDKVWNMIQGRLRFFFRAHLEDMNVGDKITTMRMLSISPKPHELQINRGMNVDSYPADIKLDYDEFCKTLGLDTKPTKKSTAKSEAQKVVEEKKTSSNAEDVKKAIEEVKKEEVKKANLKTEEVKLVETQKVVEEVPQTIQKPAEIKPKKTEEPKIEATPKTEAPKVETAQEKLARIKELLAKKNVK